MHRDVVTVDVRFAKPNVDQIGAIEPKYESADYVSPQSIQTILENLPILINLMEDVNFMVDILFWEEPMNVGSKF